MSQPSPRVAPVVGNEVPQHRQQERTKLALRPIDSAQVFMPQHTFEERLRQIFGIMRRPAAAPKKDIDWVPISPAEFFERLVRLLRLPPARLEDNAPMRRRKDG